MKRVLKQALSFSGYVAGMIMGSTTFGIFLIFLGLTCPLWLWFVIRRER